MVSARSGTVSGENDNGATQKPRAEAIGNEKASSLDLPVAFEGLVITPRPEPSLVSRPTTRRQTQETAMSASYSPRSHKKGIRVEAKKLFEARKPVQSPEWTQDELKQLVEFMYTDGKTWAQHIAMRFREQLGSSFSGVFRLRIVVQVNNNELLFFSSALQNMPIVFA